MTTFRTEDDVLTLLIHLVGYRLREIKQFLFQIRRFVLLYSVFVWGYGGFAKALKIDKKDCFQGHSKSSQYNDEKAARFHFFSMQQNFRELWGKGFADIVYVPKSAFDKPHW